MPGRWAREFDLRTIGLLYYVAASSETLGQAVQRIERFSGVGNEAVIFRVTKAADLDTRLDYAGVARHSDRHQVEFFMTTLVRLYRSLTGLSLTPFAGHDLSRTCGRGGGVQRLLRLPDRVWCGARLGRL